MAIKKKGTPEKLVLVVSKEKLKELEKLLEKHGAFDGVKTGRFQSKKPNKSNSPKETK